MATVSQSLAETITALDERAAESQYLRVCSSEQEANAFRDGLEFFDDSVEVEDVFEDSDETWAVKFRRVA